MEVVADRKACTGCGACAAACRAGAIVLGEDDEGFAAPVVDASRCVDCGLCKRLCPVNRPRPAASSEPKAYAVAHADREVLARSSSGGMFTALSEDVMVRGGVVFGAAFGDDLNVRHGWSETLVGTGRFRGAKYLQGRADGAFAVCRGLLAEGREVLFTGLPCQVAGLLAYLGGVRGGLLTVDLICHGVPSPMLWQKHRRELEARQGARMTAASFRCKDDGWSHYKTAYRFDDGSVVKKDAAHDDYMRLFLHDNALREGCYACPFKGQGHVADLTIADFWGVQTACPDMFDDAGTSLVLVRTSEGAAAFARCADKVTCRQVGLEAALRGNPSYSACPRRDALRDTFYLDLPDMTIGDLAAKYAADSRPTRVQRLKALPRRAARKLVRVLLGEERARRLKCRAKELLRRG